MSGKRMTRKRIIAGNWKMHKTNAEAEEFAVNLKVLLARISKDIEVWVCPPATAISCTARVLDKTDIKIAGQNMHFEEQGAFTGEISGVMLKGAGATHVMLGHSERRHIFNEDNAMINKKMHAAFKANLIPILCIGETMEEKKEGLTSTVLENQLKGCLEGISKNQAQILIIAYEPVWAISNDDPTHKPATPDDAEEAHSFIRDVIEKIYDKTIADNINILYGGSVNPGNAKAILDMKNIDGALVGGASLKPGEFAEIVAAAKF